MALEIRRNGSQWWYGRVEADGRSITKNLGVKLAGKVPASLRKVGDIVFERSRAKAQAALEKLQNDLKSRMVAEDLVQSLHEIRTGRRVSTIPLNQITEHWRALLRRRPLSNRYMNQTTSDINRLIAFVQEKAPRISRMDQIHSTLAVEFFRAERARGIAAKTYNNLLIHIRSVFQRLRKQAGLAENPFEGIPLLDAETVFRKPFSAEELAVIEEKARADQFIYPMIVTGMCTAMRRGDCCKLVRGSVDLETDFITVKTSKTGETVQIPIFPLLRRVLVKAMAQPEGPAPHYVFPELAAHYRTNPDHLTDRVRRVLKAAGFFNPRNEEEKSRTRGEVQRTREDGMRRASVRDFHSFRVSWVTVALTAGVPLEIVQRVTGHRTSDIVLKHYFQPGKEDFRRTLALRLPALLGDRSLASEPEFDVVMLKAKLTAMEEPTWRHIRDELLGRLPAEKNVTPPQPARLKPYAAA
jgi:integrase